MALAASNARKVVGAFRAAGAVSGGKASHLAALRLNQSTTLRELVELGVIRKAGGDRYFLDEEAWAQRRQVSARMVLRVAVPLGLALAAAWLYWGAR